MLIYPVLLSFKVPRY